MIYYVESLLSRRAGISADEKPETEASFPQLFVGVVLLYEDRLSKIILNVPNDWDDYEEEHEDASRDEEFGLAGAFPVVKQKKEMLQENKD